MSTYNVVAASNESTVVTEYEPQSKRSDAYQSEAALEQAFIKMLEEQGYAYFPIHENADLVANLRRQLELLNNYTFTDKEWDFFFKDKIANANDGIKEKTRRSISRCWIKRTSTTTACRSLTSMWRTAATMITAMMSQFW